MNNNKGFTLAEVLITLGIIGVITAITLPALHSKYEKKIIETGLKQTYSDLYNLIKRSEVDNGSYEDWDYSMSYDNGNTSDKFVEKYFAPYVHLTECKSHNNKNMPKKCFAGSDGNFYVWRYPNQNELSIGGDYRISPKYLLNDGRSLMIMVKNTPMYGDYWKYIIFVVDVNGQRGQSIMGQDVFVFSLSTYLRYGTTGKEIKGFHVGSSENDGDFAYSTEKIYNFCQPGNNLGTHKCGILLERNNWKFPKDYPIKF